MRQHSEITLLLVGAITVFVLLACNVPTPAADGAGEPEARPPRIHVVTPQVSPEDGGVPVSIKGRSFHPWCRVRFGNFELTKVNVISDREIRVVAPAGIGAVDVTVINPGNLKHERADAFTYLPTTPETVETTEPSESP